MPDDTLTTLLARRREAAGVVAQLDHSIARLTAAPPRRRGQRRPNVSGGPYVLVRDDGAVYAGRWRGYRHDEPPHPFVYRGAAESRAKRDRLETWLVVTRATWQAAKGGSE
jgi:hypothetical protein